MAVEQNIVQISPLPLLCALESNPLENQFICEHMGVGRLLVEIRISLNFSQVGAWKKNTNILVSNPNVK